MSGTFGHELSIELAAAPEAVWAIVADYGRDPEWRKGVSMRHEPAGLVREGTRTFEDLLFFGKNHHTEARIHDVVSGRFFRFTSLDGNVTGSRRVEPHAGGSRLTVAVQVKVPSRLFAPLAGWLYRREVQGNLRRLQALLQTDAHPEAALEFKD